MRSSSSIERHSGGSFSDGIEGRADPVRSIDTHALLRDLPGGDLHPAAVVLALMRDSTVATQDIVAAAKLRLATRTPRLHTFVPLYLTNHCDSECKMCAMRASNRKLVREFATKKTIQEQMRILSEHEGVHGIGLLTGEYRDPYTRLANAFLVGWAIRTALDMGFQRVYFNIGSMVPDEIGVLADWFDRNEPVRMCVFQETYDREIYARFMGTTPDVPKADYDRRIRSFEHWLDAGFHMVNPGALVGLNRDPAAEAASLVSHVTELAERGADVHVSLPRLRPAQETRNASGVNDDLYLRMIASLAFACPEHRLVLTTREDEAFQRKAIDLCGVFSPGSPDVAPYRQDLHARNAVETSQFSVADLRRPRDILLRLQSDGYSIDNFAWPPS